MNQATISGGIARRTFKTFRRIRLKAIISASFIHYYGFLTVTFINENEQTYSHI